MHHFASALATVIFVYIFYVWGLKQCVDQKRFLLSLGLAATVVTLLGLWTQ